MSESDPLELKEGVTPSPYRDLPTKKLFSIDNQWGSYVWLDVTDLMLGYKIFRMFRQMFNFIPKEHQTRIEIIYKPELIESGQQTFKASLGWKWNPLP